MKNYFEEIEGWFESTDTNIIDFNMALLANGNFKDFKCPFCKKNESNFISNLQVIECFNKKCKARGPIGKNKEEALKKWSKI